MNGWEWLGLIVLCVLAAPGVIVILIYFAGAFAPSNSSTMGLMFRMDRWLERHGL